MKVDGFILRNQNINVTWKIDGHVFHDKNCIPTYFLKRYVFVWAFNSEERIIEITTEYYE